jgi:hypothetical protein
MYSANSFFVLLLSVLLPVIVISQQRLGVYLQGGLFRCSCRALGICELCIKGGFAREKLFVLHGGDVTP